MPSPECLVTDDQGRPQAAVLWPRLYTQHRTNYCHILNTKIIVCEPARLSLIYRVAQVCLYVGPGVEERGGGGGIITDKCRIEDVDSLIRPSHIPNWTHI